MPDDKAHLIVVSFEPWHGPGFDNDQRSAAARPPGIGANSIQPLGAEPGIDPADPEDPYPAATEGSTFTYTYCTSADASNCINTNYTTSFTTTGYNSADPGVVARQRRQLRALGADALLFDITNGAYRYPDNPPGNALYNMMQQSVPALYAGMSGSGTTDLKLIPLFGVLEQADVSDANNGFGKLLDDWYQLATVTYPGRNILYEGLPLAVIFHAVETHAPACSNAAVPCWQLADDYLSTHRPSTSTDTSKSWFDYVTFRHMGGFYDSQPGARGEIYPGTSAARVTGTGASEPTYWTWVDRYVPGYQLLPSYAASEEQYLLGQVEAFTACNAAGSASWSSSADGAGDLRAYINGALDPTPFNDCYQTRRGGFACNWGTPGNYPPDATVRLQGGVWAFQRYLQIARALRPTFLIVNQWNQFEQTDEGFDFQSTHDLEPANWGPDALIPGSQDVDPYAPYQMAQTELSNYRAGLGSGQLLDISYRAGVSAGNPIIGGMVLPAGDWQVQLTGRGPSLAPYLGDYLAAPTLSTFDGSGVATGAACSATDADSCLGWDESSGTFTAQLGTANGQRGVALLDINNIGTSSFPNASARSYDDLTWNDGEPIAGFVISGGSGGSS